MRLQIMVLFFICSAVNYSQNCSNTLSGVVIDLHDNSSLIGSTIVIKELNKAVVSESDGSFNFKNICNGLFTLVVSHPDCKTLEFSVKVNGDTTKTLKLEHHYEALNEVIVSGSSESLPTNTSTVQTITQKAIDDSANESLGDVLKNLSGVSTFTTGNAIVKPIINGLHSSRITIMNAGTRMEDQEWGSEHAPNIDVNTANNIKVVKNASALQYSGDAIGGVIIVEPERIPVKDTLYGSTIISGQTNGRGYTLNSRLIKSFDKGWFASANGTIKRYGDFEAPDYVLSNTGVSDKGIAMRFGLNRFNSGFEVDYSIFDQTIGILRASHLGGSQDQFAAINSNRPLIIRDFTYDIDRPRQEVIHHLATIKGFKKFEKIGKFKFRYDFQQNNRQEFDIRRGDDAKKASLDLRLITHTIALDLESPLSDQTKLKSGINGSIQNNYPNPNTGVKRLIPDYDKYDLGIYSILDSKLNDKLSFEIGARIDYTFIDAFKFYNKTFWESRNYDILFPEFFVEDLGTQILANPELDFLNFSGTAGINYRISDNSELVANLSIGSRNPNPSELFSEGLHHSASRIELGDIRFNSEQAKKIAIGYSINNEKFSLNVNPYINFIKDFIIIEPVELRQTIRGNFQVWEYRQTDALLTGFDIDASWELATNFQIKNQFSLVKGYEQKTEEPLINMPPVNTTNSISYVNPKLNNLEVSLESIYTFRQNEFPNNNFEDFIPETGTIETIDVSTPPSAFHLMNLNAGMDLHLFKNMTSHIGLKINNVFNKSYRNYLNNLRYYADDLGRNLILSIKLNY